LNLKNTSGDFNIFVFKSGEFGPNFSLKKSFACVIRFFRLIFDENSPNRMGLGFRLGRPCICDLMRFKKWPIEASKTGSYSSLGGWNSVKL
jgi:hypothetical protein